MIGLHVAQLFKRSAAGTLERVLWIDDLGRGLYAIDVESSSALPVFHRANVIVDGLRDGTIEVVTEDPWLQPISEEAIPPIQRARRDEAWALIKPLVMDQPAIFQEERLSSGSSLNAMPPNPGCTVCYAGIGSGAVARMPFCRIFTGAAAEARSRLPGRRSVVGPPASAHLGSTSLRR